MIASAAEAGFNRSYNVRQDILEGYEFLSSQGREVLMPRVTLPFNEETDRVLRQLLPMRVLRPPELSIDLTECDAQGIVVDSFFSNQEEEVYRCPLTLGELKWGDGVGKVIFVRLSSEETEADLTIEVLRGKDKKYHIYSKDAATQYIEQKINENQVLEDPSTREEFNAIVTLKVKP
ncbi:hypothetical protein DID78_06510 [Candidatus Marinamargulisbacteria bacterium SCGC AG-343-D04]|nr:hypothetical protein DID78_06510 [Candidatus Marinamargulisbacteria bacterium SCGC AG-343-D04]